MAQNNNFEAPNVYAENFRPYVLITEQPAIDSHIFRYAAEIQGSKFRKRNSGCIVGVNSQTGNKTYPSIKVMGNPGPYIVVVSCVTEDGPPFRPHPYNLCGKRCQNGVYVSENVNGDITHSLKNIVIERVKKKDVLNSLQKRKTLKIDPFLTGFEDGVFDLNSVRLCFQVFIQSPDFTYSTPLEPVVSYPIYDKRYLRMKKLSHNSASVAGGTESIALCDQVDKTVEKLPDDLKAAMLSGDLSDILVRVKGEEFKLHRAILAARSTYFFSMFKNDMKEKNTGIVSIDDCEPDIFRTFVHFIYTGKVDKLLPENMCELYEVADKYQEDQLKKQCLDFMMKTLSEESFCDLITLALKYDEKKLFEKAVELFTSKPNKIVRRSEWQNFVENCPIQANELFVKVVNRHIK